MPDPKDNDEIARLTAELATARAELAALRKEQESWAEKEIKIRVDRDRAIKAAGEFATALAARLRIENAGLGKGAEILRKRFRPPSRTEAVHLELIRDSDLFDAPWYLRAYPDVVHLGMDPALHFLRHPFEPFRSPSEHFNIAQYCVDHPDVLKDKVNPLVHFLLSPESRGAESYPPRRR
ncbi:MAG: hypothetical protein ABIR39_01595 [Nocardioides sp.]|uniref:hypothetical protein n=1 Tax=Nocardioides sp. TaxID=35761 RepID=UPI0032641482